jgi:hypothetical protein
MKSHLHYGGTRCKMIVLVKMAAASYNELEEVRVGERRIAA